MRVEVSPGRGHLFWAADNMDSFSVVVQYRYESIFTFTFTFMNMDRYESI